ncbi:hypothetical protein [Paenibacillus sp. BR1-192]|uniref:hypothetical protein n=1 Tax=Paenibacillus sp. BR1-192 TaxID=3032287 RepID=UPI00240E88C2|nr:hypothetical protein [Paenibacillus sp. BR1-192]WFB59037.1 hypothetical protein P0X86_01980 [Paenibacillus sp. BR1-192]
MSLKKRTKRISTDKSYPQLTSKQALDMAISAKKAEGLRSRTINDYESHFEYFVKWLGDNYPDIEYVDEITTAIIRDFILYMKHDARRYDGHK